MFQKSEKNITKKKRYNKKMFIFPLIVCGIGLIICFIVIKLFPDPLNPFGITGIIVLNLGTMLFFNALVKERYRLKLKLYFPLDMIFPAYRIVKDYDQLTSDLSSFKEVYSDFMNNVDSNKSNSRIQDYATQMLWHCIYLQKKTYGKTRGTDRSGIQQTFLLIMSSSFYCLF